MKTITLAMACFIGFVLCSAAVAYYPMPIVRECPHCNAHFVHEEGGGPRCLDSLKGALSSESLGY